MDRSPAHAAWWSTERPTPPSLGAHSARTHPATHGLNGLNGECHALHTHCTRTAHAQHTVVADHVGVGAACQQPRDLISVTRADRRPQRVGAVVVRARLRSSSPTVRGGGLRGGRRHERRRHRWRRAAAVARHVLVRRVGHRWLVELAVLLRRWLVVLVVLGALILEW